MSNKQDDRSGKSPVAGAKDELQCGIIMPISGFEGCSAEHWSEVKSIIQDAVDSINAPKFTARLVSDADDVGVIHKRIVQGVYSSDIIVCDVSGKNSNVMFELGLRLAFDRPTIIIKDDKTDYSFDTSIIEHIEYPRDLRFGKIVDFKKTLAQKISATYEASLEPNHSTFLKSFGTFKIAHLDEREASEGQIVLEMLNDIQKDIAHLWRAQTTSARKVVSRKTRIFDDNIANAIRRMYPNTSTLRLLPNDELISRLESDPGLTKGYPTRESFVDAIIQTCEVLSSGT